MALSSAGELLLPHARLMLHEMDLAAEEIDALRGLSRGTARVGAVAAAARGILPEAVRQLLQAHPGLRVSVLEAPEDGLLAALADREVDLIIAAQIALGSDVTRIGECRFDDDYCAFCARDASLPENPSLAQVMQERWIMPGGGATPRVLFENLVAQAGLGPPDVAVETGSLGVMVSLVSQTKLLGWLPRPLLLAEEAAGTIRFLNVPQLAVRRRFFLYRRSAGLLPRAAQRLKECLPLM